MSDINNMRNMLGVEGNGADTDGHMAPVLPMKARRPATSPSSADEWSVSWTPHGVPDTIYSPPLPSGLPASEVVATILEALGKPGAIPPGYIAYIADTKVDSHAWTRTNQWEENPDSGKSVKSQATTTIAVRYLIKVVPASKVPPLPAEAVADQVDMDSIRKRLSKPVKARTAKAVVKHTGIVRAHCVGDDQVGKGEGGGSSAIVDRSLDVLAQQVERVHSDRRAGLLGYEDPGALIVTADCIENTRGHYSAQAALTDLTLTEQIEVATDIMVRRIQTLADIYPAGLSVAATYGNHDEASRNSSGKQEQRASDNFVATIMRMSARLLAASGNYQHVSFYLPRHDDITVTLDLGGTRVTVAHGHQWRSGKAMDWWAKQALGLNAAGESSVLISGHYHTLHVEQDARTWVQLPSMDGGSAWFNALAGVQGAPGAVDLDLYQGDVRGIRVIRPTLTSPGAEAAATITRLGAGEEVFVDTASIQVA